MVFWSFREAFRCPDAQGTIKRAQEVRDVPQAVTAKVLGQDSRLGRNVRGKKILM